MFGSINTENNNQNKIEKKTEVEKNSNADGVNWNGRLVKFGIAIMVVGAALVILGIGLGIAGASSSIPPLALSGLVVIIIGGAMMLGPLGVMTAFETED
jgi:dipeptide/tripeptide permease